MAKIPYKRTVQITYAASLRRKTEFPQVLIRGSTSGEVLPNLGPLAALAATLKGLNASTTI